MSYLRPRRWWLWLGMPVARCQRLGLRGQWAAGARCFDLRVWRRGGRWEFAHGAVSFDSRVDLTDAVEEIAAMARESGERATVRLILERSRGEADSREFRRRADELRAWTPEVEWIGGFRKRDWAPMVTWAGDRGLRQAVGSMAEDARWYERVIPWLYARRCNGRTLREAPAAAITLVDFIDQKG